MISCLWFRRLWPVGFQRWLSALLADESLFAIVVSPGLRQIMRIPIFHQFRSLWSIKHAASTLAYLCHRWKIMVRQTRLYFPTVLNRRSILLWSHISIWFWLWPTWGNPWSGNPPRILALRLIERLVPLPILVKYCNLLRIPATLILYQVGCAWQLLLQDEAWLHHLDFPLIFE